jgi:peptidoglycan/xylan/chitin deacetylase (PgdA/CDA1 family)
MMLRSQLGAMRRHVLCSMYRRELPLGNVGPIVSFTFDDFPRSALMTGGTVLESVGGHATYYVAMGLIGQSNRLGEQFRHEDLVSLVKRGHELANHTFSHSSARRVETCIFKEDVERDERTILESTGIASSGNFAYPYGESTLRSKRILGPQMRSCRGTCGGFNGPNVDLNLLRANNLYGDVDQAERAKVLMMENKRRRSWLIFYSHDVCTSPSRFGCTPNLLHQVAEFAVKSGARLLTVAQVLDEMGCPAKQQTTDDSFAKN